MAKKSKRAASKTRATDPAPVAAPAVAPLTVEYGVSFRRLNDREIVIPGSRSFSVRVGPDTYTHVAETSDGDWIFRLDK